LTSIRYPPGMASALVLHQFFTEPGSIRLEDALLHLVSGRPSATVDVEAERQRLDRWADRLSQPTIDATLRLVYGDLGFTANTEQYYHPMNSYLDAVLEQRKGIPITLSVVVLALARRRGVDLRPIGMPGHFMLRAGADGDFIDPFAQGHRVHPAELERLIAHRIGGEGSHHLAEVSDQEIVCRVVRNLTAALAQRPNEPASWLLQASASIPPELLDPHLFANLAERRGELDVAARYLEQRGAHLDLDDPQRRGFDLRASMLRARLN